MKKRLTDKVLRRGRSIRDEKGRLIKLINHGGTGVKYYKGPDGQGIIKQDEFGEYIEVNGEKQYWKGIIKALPNDPRLNSLKTFSFLVLKPDAISRNLVQKLISDINQLSLKITATKFVYLEHSQIYRLYPYFLTKDWEERLLEYLAGKPAICSIVVGKNVISKLKRYRYRARRKYTNGDLMINLIHCSDSKKSAMREALIFFTVDKIINSLK